MKEKVITRLKELFPGVNLSKARLDSIGDGLNDIEEADIDARLKALDKIMNFTETAKFDDKIRTIAAKEKKDSEDKAKAEADKKSAEEKEAADKKAKEDADKGGGGQQQPDIKAMLAEAIKAVVDPLKEELQGLKAGKVAETRLQALQTKLKDFNPILKDAYIDNFDPAKFGTEEAFQEHLTAVETKLTTATQLLSDQGLGQTGRPFTPTGGSAAKEASKEEASALLKSILPA
ncbi:hypothetical protein [Dyadobacter sp. LHD-138]|uniref:hypothetical protein n=1 Tax=Dyadobacter sp. LHD-138 TaxID=3071413 RepID=UPI0027E1C267|nr:hypothetical protein [Dyadobacter sp. LHD-138]MDQ6482229.1 hypothetical protein [Dyadobacter sp. LHD-138]